MKVVPLEEVGKALWLESGRLCWGGEISMIKTEELKGHKGAREQEGEGTERGTGSAAGGLQREDRWVGKRDDARLAVKQGKATWC